MSLLQPSSLGLKRPAFTLVELLVVMSIIALLIAILLPALGKSREVADATFCASNERQIGIIASAYGTDSKGWMAAPYFQGYSGAVFPPVGVGGNALPIPTTYASVGMTSTLYGHADHYIATGYIAASKVDGAVGNPLFICPTADRLGAGRVIGSNVTYTTNVECHYSFTPLLIDPYRINDQATSYNSYRRTNAYGAYKGDEILKPSLTFFAGDAVLVPGIGNTTNGTLAPRKTWGWDNLGPNATLWSIGTGPTIWGSVLPSSSYTFTSGVDVPTTHPPGANTLYFDGHANLIKPGGYSTTGNACWQYGPNFTADFSGRCAPYAPNTAIAATKKSS